MNRLLGLLGVCVLVGATALSAQSGPTRPPARGAGGGQPRNPQATGRAATDGNRQELQQLRDEIKRLQAEAKRLEQQIKQDKTAGNREAVKSDTEALKKIREDMKRAQERLKAAQQGGRKGGGRGGL